MCFFCSSGDCHAGIVLYPYMIGKLTGTFGGVSHGVTLVEVGGVGYAVRTPLFAIENMRNTGGEISLFIYTAVREDSIDLYGFSTQEELEFFKQLISVKGLGPKTALGVMNVADTASLKRSISAGDAKTLTKVFGIGKKSAERIVVELRDKLAQEIQSPSTALGAKPSDDFEVIEALMALGYRADESRAALKEAGGSGPGVRERLSAALKHLGKRSGT